MQTKARILDSAEQLFAERGFEGASLRDIAKLSDVQVGLVHHHGGGKEELFHQTVTRRADELASLRLERLEALKQSGEVSLRGLLDVFMRAYVTLAQTGGAQWQHYGRLVAHVSADPRWRALAAQCFDPTANRFIEEIMTLHPDAERQAAATGQVYSVAAMLAFLNTGWRIEALSPGAAEAQVDQLIDFCTAGMEAILTPKTE
ncbi:MAG: TetR family transcriptional regulator [Rhodobacteraceae bacterium]|nr:TetR family transcriptional regulator [Paracoccaceae bacterium]